MSEELHHLLDIFDIQILKLAVQEEFFFDIKASKVVNIQKIPPDPPSYSYSYSYSYLPSIAFRLDQRPRRVVGSALGPNEAAAAGNPKLHSGRI